MNYPEPKESSDPLKDLMVTEATLRTRYHNIYCDEMLTEDSADWKEKGLNYHKAVNNPLKSSK